MSYLSDFQELNGGYVAFGGNPKGGKISATKDETSPSLKNFITGLKNQFSLKVKVIRSDNRTEFKNSDLNQFCRIKGIKREFSVPRTRQQNGIAERKNRTLIKAVRTMLVNSLLPIPFWAEAVNIACYVKNRVLVTKPHNKTPYELLHGRTPSTGPTWPFDIYSLTKTMNYQPVSAGNQTNPNAEQKGDTAFAEKEHDAEKPEFAVNLSPSRSALLGEKDDMTKKKDKGKSPVECFSKYRDLNAIFEDFSEDNSNDVSAASPIVPTTRQHYSNNTNPINAAGPIVNAAGHNYSNITNPISAAGPSNSNSSLTHGQSLLRDTYQPPDMVEREDIDYSDHENVGAEADFNNLETYHTYASFMGFMVYQIDVKSAFLYGTIEEEVYVCQPPGFEDPDHPDKVYKVVKQKKNGIFINQDKYVAEILKKFGLTEGKSVSTPIDTEKPLLKDPDGEDVDVHIYISMLGSLMYLTSSRPDIMFA
nr:putative ribonuclease H-like domain-containing protein [Tanacetum cinerariifolium]